MSRGRIEHSTLSVGKPRTMSNIDKTKKLLKLKEGLEQICEEDELSDPLFAKAAKIEASAWGFVFSKKNYDPQKALELVKEAAKLHHEFEPKVQAIENYINRKEKIGKVNFKKSIKKLFFPILKEMGFEMYDWFGKKVSNWNRDTLFKKIKNNIEIQINIGPTKFGHQLELLLIRKSPESDYEYLDMGLSHEEMEYLNQDELDEVFNRVINKIKLNVDSWFKATP